MDERASILVQVLADTDAVWIPSRTWNRPRPTNVYFARRAFAKGGVPWESGGATEADRKAMQRALEALAKSGAVKVRRPHRVKTLAVKLADTAEAEARKLVGLPGMYSGWLSAGGVAPAQQAAGRSRADDRPLGVGTEADRRAAAGRIPPRSGAGRRNDAAGAGAELRRLVRRPATAASSTP